MRRRFGLVIVLMWMFAGLVAPAQTVFAATATAGNAAELIAAINAANLNPDADTIILTGDVTLNTAYESSGTYGATGLPPVTTPVIIEGQGLTIARDTGAGIANFRIFRVAAGASLTLNNLTVTQGDVSNANGCSTVVTHCGGGAFNEGTLTVLHSLFTGNSAVRGGGIYNNTGGNLTITGSTFDSNAATGGTSQQGGGVYTTAGVTSIKDSIFNENTSASVGGGVFNFNSTLTINGSTFSGNSAANNGGAVFGASTISGSTFLANFANIGAALFVSVQSAAVSTSTFAGNTANNQGGAIYFADSGSNTLTVAGSTFFGNNAPSGGGIVSNTRPVTVRDSILMNSMGGNCAVLAGGAVNGDAFSLTDNNTNCTGFITSASINLGSLAANGGATETFALNAGSAAIDSGPGRGRGSKRRHARHQWRRRNR